MKHFIRLLACSVVLCAVSQVRAATDTVISASPNSGPTPLTVTFSGTVNSAGSCDASEYMVSFGDGTSRQVDAFARQCRPQQFSFTHTFISPGQFRVALFGTSLRSVAIDHRPAGEPLSSTEVNVTGAAQSPLSMPNPEYNIDPKSLFPDKESLLPAGVTYDAAVPDTLDLAERATWHIIGSTKAVDPSAYYAPAGAALEPEFAHYGCSPRPCLTAKFGAIQWGRVMLALAEARRMSEYDRNDSHGTVSRQYAMMENMLDYGVQRYIAHEFNTANAVVLGPGGINPSSTAMQALIAEWEQRPTPALTYGINQFLLMHYDDLTSVTEGDATYRVYNLNRNPRPDSLTGYQGDLNIPLAQGVPLRVLARWSRDSHDPLATWIGQQLSTYLHSGVLWQIPSSYTARSGPQPPPEPTRGHFIGHIYAWLQAAMGFVNQARELRGNEAEAAGANLAQKDIDSANAIYNFVKTRTQAGLIGNFGSQGATGDMVILGIGLSNAGAGDHYDEVEAWTRNQLAEGQIDEEISRKYIPNDASADYLTDHVGDKVFGLHVCDGTHVLAIPKSALGFSRDCPSNAFHGLYEVWNHTIDVHGSNAQVNFLLNRAGQYMDVNSDLPYRGRVEINTKQSLGSLTDLLVHIPNWTNKRSVVVGILRPDGNVTTVAWSWGGPYGNYAHITGIQPNTSYVVRFALPVTTQPIYQLRSDNGFWYENSYPGVHSMETVITYQGTFRGNTLVDATPRPYDGIPRYQRQSLAALGNAEAAPPMRTVKRFVFQGTAASIPIAAERVQRAAGAPGSAP